MAQEIKLPQLGQTMEEGTIVNILIKPGDKIEKGDVIFEVETDKATLEMESPAGGFVKKILVTEGETILVGEPVCIVGDENEQIADTPDKAEPAANEPAKQPANKSVDLPADAKIVRLQKLGQTMEEGTIVSILAKVGESVVKGDVLFEIETDKATLEMESSVEGVVKAMIVSEDETILVDAPMAIVANGDTEITDEMIAAITGEETPAPPQVEPKPAPQPQTLTQDKEQPKPATQKVEDTDRIFASPRAKMTAQELGIDLKSIEPKAGKVRIDEADVRSASQKSPQLVISAAAQADESTQQPAADYELGQTIPITRMQKVVGDRMLQSKRDIPCFYLNTTIDMTELFAYRAKLNKTSNVKVSFNDFIIKAMALGCRQYPIMAGQLSDKGIKVASNINVGLAISVEDGLVAPVSKDADKKSMVELAAYNVAMIDRAKNGKLAPDELAGGCITLSNLGAFGVDWFIPIVVPGQCSIIGVGKIKDTLVPSDGNILVRKTMSMTISVDHKVANGAYAAQFLDYVKKLLENTSTFA